MLRKLNCFYSFSRSRLRRGPVFDAKLKDYSSNQRIRDQVKQKRIEFQTQGVESTFTEALRDNKLKLAKRFKLDKQKLNKDIKTMIKLRIKPQLLEPMGDKQDDLKFLEEGKSFLHDQTAEVEFYQKFKKQQFMKKQTNRMLSKQENNYTNFLPQNENNSFNKYQKAKTKLKNNRIDSMMNYKRNNQQLQLLLDSGLMEEPSNLKMLINKINENEGVYELEQRLEHQIKEIQGVKVKSIGSNSLSEQKEVTLKEKMAKNVIGPQQITDFTKIDEFLDMYNKNTESEKLKVNEDVNLLHQVRSYQKQLFLSRYDQINFRFKGRVLFDNFKENELLSYVKTQQIEPVELLQIFQQNKDKINRFKQPIMTPAVVSRIYTKTSTYRFPQNDENNHINLISHPTFIKLQRTLFKELDKVNDELFCDAVWSYAKNHEMQQGLLNISMSNAIQKAIFDELVERIGRLREVDLGLLVRSLIKMNLIKNEEYLQKWGQVLQILQERLPLMKQTYEYQSVMEFLHLLPSSEKTVAIIAKNINFFDAYKWQDKSTLLTFGRVCSLLISKNSLIQKIQHNKVFLRLCEIVNNKTEQLKEIIPTLTINEIPNFIIILSELNKHPYAPEIPSILINIAKKQVVNSIHMQKHKIYQYTIPTLLAALSNYDYYNNVIKSSRYLNNDLTTPFQMKNVVKMASLRHMLPGRAFVFNSKLYFAYHELAKFMENQISFMSLRSIGQSLYALSLVQYKNEGLYDSITFKALQKIEAKQREQKKQNLSYKEVSQLIKIVYSYSLQKRSTDVVQQIYDKILAEGRHHLKKIPLTALINLFGAYTNIFSPPTVIPEEDGQENDHLMSKWKRNKATLFIFSSLYKNVISQFVKRMEIEEIISLYVTNSMFLNNVSRIIESNNDFGMQAEFQPLREKYRQNVVSLLEIIGNMKEKLNQDYCFVISLSLQLNSCDIEIESLGLQKDLLDFEKYQKSFYQKNIDEILRHQQHVGTNISTKLVYKKFLENLQKEEGNQIKQNLWSIQVSNKNTVYFIATYEHLMSKSVQKDVSLGLFGIWKIYSQIYRRKMWNFQIVLSMLQ